VFTCSLKISLSLFLHVRELSAPYRLKFAFSVRLNAFSHYSHVFQRSTHKSPPPTYLKTPKLMTRGERGDRPLCRGERLFVELGDAAEGVVLEEVNR
jgi:hypothetical protein